MSVPRHPSRADRLLATAALCVALLGCSSTESVGPTTPATETIAGTTTTPATTAPATSTSTTTTVAATTTAPPMTTPATPATAPPAQMVVPAGTPDWAAVAAGIGPLALPSDCPLPLGQPGLMPNSDRSYRGGVHQGIDFVCMEYGHLATLPLPGRVLLAMTDYVEPS